MLNSPQLSLPATIYYLLFTMLGLVYITGLFVPLMDNDSAHHANIGLHMYLTGNYVELNDAGKDYLDKPHLLFWLCAMSYHLFGVTGFAYKFPSFLFSIGAIYSTYKLGARLYNKEVGKLAALICATAFAFILQNNDIRMDAVLTATVVFATWQLVCLVQDNKILYAVTSALGLALAFSTKGMIGVFAAGTGILFYIFYLKKWSALFNWRWLIVLIFFALFISPVVYCYYLQFNLHPEKVVRGQSNINGVRFILWGQNFERYDGNAFADSVNKDYFFFLHSFLWAFAPWSLLMYTAVFLRLRHFATRKHEWLTTGLFVVMLLVFSFSGFKLPHYLNVMFPVCGIITAVLLTEKSASEKWSSTLLLIQEIVSVLLVIACGVVNIWFFTMNTFYAIFFSVLLFAIWLWSFGTKQFSKMQKLVLISCCTIILCFFMLNANFYPQLLTYQGGNEMAKLVKNESKSRLYSYDSVVSSSFDFYTASLHKTFSDSAFNSNPYVWVISDSSQKQNLRNNYTLGKQDSVLQYHITKLKFNFVLPATRKQACKPYYITQVFPKNK